MGNIGNLYSLLHRWQEARAALEQAISLCDQRIPAASGAFKGTLAYVVVQDGLYEEALSLLSEGEEQVKVMPEEYGKFLCKKVKVFHQMELKKEAQEAFRTVKELTEKRNIKKDSALFAEIQAAKNLL